MSYEGSILRELREECGLTQKGLAAKAGLSPTTVRNVERGRGRLTMEVLVQLLSALEAEPFMFCMGVAMLRAADLDPLVADRRTKAGQQPGRGRKATEFEWALGVIGEAFVTWVDRSKPVSFFGVVQGVVPPREPQGRK